ncbi:helicase C-terminal domain-containing protein [Treponema sp.]|uniref:helicase C-terminal domain-containing protein n=1 Tax=Treponema sp. TaxID=166 RepID=UPI00257D959B|nr:helicase C-terminal domain-containing protein [Treponema sp.]MBE6354472.1 helicase [Treponema sp.]
MNVHERFARPVITAMQRDIKEAGGNEVFWSGIINADGLITGVRVGSRGNSDSVIVNDSVAREGHVLIHNHPSGVLFPSEADQNIALNANDTSLGFYIVNNDVSDVYVVVEPVKPKKTEFLDEEQTAGYLSENGPLAALSDHYEKRPSQTELLKSIVRAFNEAKTGVFEAGTGVGKSFAYLIPSILWAVKNKERVVLSTGTINLQQQLFEKDIPMAQKILGTDIKSILLKGRQNYVCLRRLGEAGKERDLFSEDTEIFDRIADWAKTTSTGSRSDLSFMPPDSVWTRVNSESDACLGGRCPYREQCFVMKVRKEAADSNLIVVNHHLLFADIESRMNGVGYEDAAVLPPYKRIVFDEAHGIEDSATSFFSETINRFKISKQLGLLLRNFRGNSVGFLVQASAVVPDPEFLAQAGEDIEKVRTALTALDQCSISAMNGEYTCRINESDCGRFTVVFKQIEKLASSAEIFIANIRKALEDLDDDEKELPAVWETKTVLRRIEDMVTLCRNFISWDEHDDQVFWLQLKKIPPRNAGEDMLEFVQFTQTPLDIAPLMNGGVFEPMSSVVCTSATLRTGDTFDYWKRRTGISFLETDKVLEGEFPSPFPYSTNVIFAVPNDAPMPDDPAFQSYVEMTVPRLIFAAEGRTLVLFTSHDSLKNTYNSAGLKLMEAGFTVLKQGDDDRFRLLERFKNEKESVLFATDSFWEGVDVPGDSLSQVIIVKLPFSVPNDPVFAARSELVEKKGGSSFMELSVPQAVIKFRQGFGRLMRRSDDRGAVVVLDRRIVEKRYGKLFTRSVPQTRRLYNPLEYIVKEITKLLGN